MALSDRQMEGVICLFAKAFVNAANDGERKKILIDFEDTFGKNIKEWKTLCREKIETISDNGQVVEQFDTFVDRNTNVNCDKVYEIRAFQEDDIPEVCEVLNAAFGLCITPFDDRKFAKFLDNGYSFVICENGSVLGIIFACKIPSIDMDAVYIDNFAVAEYARGCGIGRKLFTHLCEKMKEDGIWLLKLQTDKTKEAYEIYKHWGFEEVDMVQMKRYVIR